MTLEIGAPHDGDDRESFRRTQILVISADPSPWPLSCEVCFLRAPSGIAAVGLGADVQLCRECLLSARDVIDDALERLDPRRLLTVAV